MTIKISDVKPSNFAKPINLAEPLNSADDSSWRRAEWTIFNVKNEGVKTGYFPFNASTHFVELKMTRFNDSSSDVVNFDFELVIMLTTGAKANIRLSNQ